MISKLIYIYIYILFQSFNFNDDSYLYNKMYLLDEESFIINDITDSKHPIKKFNNNKVLVNVIKAGNGPGELSNTMYKTIVCDSANKLIHIWDQAKQLLNTYNFNLEHIDSFSPSGTYKNLAMWLEYKKQIVYINNNAEYLYSFENQLSKTTVNDTSKIKLQYFNNYTLRQNPIVYYSENKLYVAYKYLNIIHEIRKNYVNEIELGEKTNYKQHLSNNSNYELPYSGLNPLGVLDLQVKENTIYALYSEKIYSKFDIIKLSIKGLEVHNEQKKVDKMIAIKENQFTTIQLIEKSEYIYTINRNRIITTNNGNFISTEYPTSN
jgi:hypothetical protein